METMKTHNIFKRSDEGLTLETSAFQTFHGGNSTFIKSFDKNKLIFLNAAVLKEAIFLKKG